MNRKDERKKSEENKSLLSQSIDQKLAQLEEENRQERMRKQKKKKWLPILLSLGILAGLLTGILLR